MICGKECLEERTEIFNIHSKSLILKHKNAPIKGGKWDVAEGSLLVGAVFTSEIRFGLLFTTNQISRD